MAAKDAPGTRAHLSRFWFLHAPFAAAVVATMGAMCLVLGAFELRDQLRFEVAPPRGDYRFAALLTGPGLVALLVGLVLVRDRWRDLRDGQAQLLGKAVPLRSTRSARLTLALQFIPFPPPEGWSRPVSPRGTVMWHFQTPGEDVAVWVVLARYGPKVYAALARRGSAEHVDDARALEVLGHLQDVTEFIEVEETPSAVAERLPGARTWLALERDAAAAMARPPKAPVPVDAKLNEHLRAARRYLPAKLPVGWSTPVAFTEPAEGWDDGAWMIDDDDVVILACLVTAQGRVKLAVTIFCPDQTVVTEARAMDVLKNFRGVSEFEQTDLEEGIAGARMYLGELQRGEGKLFN